MNTTYTTANLLATGADELERLALEEIIRRRSRDELQGLARQHVPRVRRRLHDEYRRRDHRGVVAELATDFDAIHDARSLRSAPNQNQTVSATDEHR